MTRGPATPARRWGALCVFVALPLVLVLLAAANAVAIADLDTQARAASLQLERYRARLSAGGIAGLRTADVSSVFVNAGSRSLAEAELQRQLVGIIERASARVVESGSSPVPEAEAGEIIEIRATLDGDNPALLRFLHTVETGMPLMTIDDLAVRRLQSEDTELSGNPQLRIDVVVRAPWKAVTS